MYLGTGTTDPNEEVEGAWWALPPPHPLSSNWPPSAMWLAPMAAGWASFSGVVFGV